MKTIFLNFPELDEALKEAKKLSNKNSIIDGRKFFEEDTK